MLSTKNHPGSDFSSLIVKRTSLMFPLIPNLAAGILGKSPGPRKLHSNCITACLPESLLKNSAHPTAAV